MSEAHESKGPLGIVIPDPDQGSAYVQVQLAFPSTMFMVWEPFEDGTPGGHNVLGFARRYAEWLEAEHPFLYTIEARFGHPQLLPRSAIPHVAGFIVAYHRREDVRAGHRSGLAVPGQPSVRQLAPGVLEIGIPPAIAGR